MSYYLNVTNRLIIPFPVSIIFPLHFPLFGEYSHSHSESFFRTAG